jgi:hypothetical protein
MVKTGTVSRWAGIGGITAAEGRPLWRERRINQIVDEVLDG